MTKMDSTFVSALTLHLSQFRTQKEFAERLGISAAYLSQLLNGRRSGRDGIRRRIAAALGFGDLKYSRFLDLGRDRFHPAGGVQDG
jgi:transcriptional regulator with XRE-family HTH domain